MTCEAIGYFDAMGWFVGAVGLFFAAGLLHHAGRSLQLLNATIENGEDMLKIIERQEQMLHKAEAELEAWQALAKDMQP